MLNTTAQKVTIHAAALAMTALLGTGTLACGASIAKQYDARIAACPASGDGGVLECWQQHPIEGEPATTCEVYVENGSQGDTWRPWPRIRANPAGAYLGMVPAGDPHVGESLTDADPTDPMRTRRINYGAIRAISVGCLTDRAPTTELTTDRKDDDQRRLDSAQAQERAEAEARKKHAAALDAVPGECARKWLETIGDCTALSGQERLDCEDRCAEAGRGAFRNALKSALRTCINGYGKDGIKACNLKRPEGSTFSEEELAAGVASCSAECKKQGPGASKAQSDRNHRCFQCFMGKASESVAFGAWCDKQVSQAEWEAIISPTCDAKCAGHEAVGLCLERSATSGVVGPIPGAGAVCVRHCAEGTDACRSECARDLQCEAACADRGTKCARRCE